MTARYEFIDDEKASVDASGKPRYTVVKMCEWMGVSTSGFYEWSKRPLSATAKRREYLKLLIEKAFADSADAPGTKMVGDITYISTWQGWL